MRATRSIGTYAGLAGRLAFGIAAFLFAVAGNARAQDGAEDAFDRGREAMLHGDYAVACPLLAESHRRDPRLGVLFTLAECEWRWGKAARAVAHYDAFLRAYTRGDAPRAAANDERQRIALARRTALAPRIGFVTLVAPASTAKPRVLVNGEAVRAEDIGAELAVEPGVVRITAAFAGEPSPIVLTLAPGEHRTVMLAIASPRDLPEAQPPPARAANVSSGPLPLSERASPSPFTYVAGAVGVAGLGVGIVAGALVIGRKGGIDAHCPNHRCDAEGLSSVDTAQSLGRVSTIGFVLGAVGVATATILFVARPARSAASARVGLGATPAGLGAFLTGTW